MKDTNTKPTNYPEAWLNRLMHNNDFAEDLLDALTEHDRECKDPEDFSKVTAEVIAQFWELEQEVA
jgi:hypothetical protein